jgi:hypothetical protein
MPRPAAFTRAARSATLPPRRKELVRTAESSSPVAALTALVDRTLTAAHVVSAPLWAVDANEPAVRVAASLAARDFDVAGIAGNPITHYVTRDALCAGGRGRTAKYASPILASNCVEKSFPLGSLFDKLTTDEYVFVLDNDEVRSIITRADLQAPAIGVVVLAYLTVIETGLKDLVLGERGDSWLEPLPEERRAAVEKLFNDKRRKNLAIGMDDCLNFSDWLTLAAAASGVRARLGFASPTSFCKTVGAFPDLRNALAHGGTILDGVDPLKALARVARVRQFAELVWSRVDGRTALWDTYASTVIMIPRRRGVLAGPGAVETEPACAPMHVITAWNPGSVQRSRDANRAANAELRAVLVEQGCRPKTVIGESPDGRWREESLLVGGLSRERAAALGALFGQTAIFELDDERLRVIRCDDGAEMRSRPRAS